MKILNHSDDESKKTKNLSLRAKRSNHVFRDCFGTACLAMTILIMVTVLIFSISAFAAVPHLLNYQGRLTDTGGSPLNGLYNITFRIYDAETAGNLLWQGTYPSVSIDKGIFNILLGDVNDPGFDFSILAFDKPYWLEIKVGTDDPMTPRQRITSAGYAISAERLVDEPLIATRGGTGSTAAANTANGVVVLDANRKLPAVDGSQLTGVLRVYDTGAQTWAANTAYTVTHNLNTTAIIVQFMFRENSSVPWKICTGHRDNGLIGVTAYDLSANSFSFRVENVSYYNSATTPIFSSGQYRVIVMAAG